MPKSAGSSVGAALLAAFPGVPVSRRVQDTSNICCGFTAFDQLGQEARDSLVVEEPELDELSRAGLVSGHFCLPTLLRLAPPQSIATVLREPRARLLSLYSWMRITTRLHEVWHPYPAFAHALRPLDDFLSEPLVAPIVDNAVCRMLLYGDPRMPALDFIVPDDIESLASDAIDRLDELGFAGVLERGRTTWEGLSQFFDATLEPRNVNVTEVASGGGGFPPAREPVTEHTLDLLEARSAVDTLIYTHALMADRTEAQAKRTGDAAFATQLVRLGDVAGRSAATAQSLASQTAEFESGLADLGETVGRLENDLARHRMWLQGIEGSVSWRITRPLRAIKRRVIRARPG